MKKPEKDNIVIELGNIYEGKQSWKSPQRGRIYDTKGLAPTIITMQGGGTEPKILTPKRNDYGKAVRKEYESGNLKESRHNMTDLKPREDKISNTLTSVQKDNLLLENSQTQQYRIRKLTERECFRLMDVDEDDINTLTSCGICKTRLYRLAGNSIVVSCMYHLFRKLFIQPENEIDENLF